MTADNAAINHAVAANLQLLRRRQGLSAPTLARLAGLEAGTLERIESGAASPEIGDLWKLATVLETPFSSLINQESAESDDDSSGVVRRRGAPHFSSADGGFTSRALFPLNGERSVEFYEIRIAAGYSEQSDPHVLGTVEYIVVASGSVDIVAGGPRQRLEAGDAISFDADQPHAYRNAGDGEAVLYMVLQYV